MASFYIHRALSHITEKRVFQVFRDLRVGYIDRIDRVERTDPQSGNKYCSFFVHLSELYDSAFAKKFIDDVITNEGSRQVKYCEKWYWIVSRSKVPKLDKSKYKKFTLSEDQLDRLKSGWASLELKDDDLYLTWDRGTDAEVSQSIETI